MDIARATEVLAATRQRAQAVVAERAGK